MFGALLQNILPLVVPGLLSGRGLGQGFNPQQQQQQLSQMSPQQRVGMTSLPAGEVFAATALDAISSGQTGPLLGLLGQGYGSVFGKGLMPSGSMNMNLKDYATGQMSDRDKAVVDNLAIHGSDRTKSLIDAYMNYYNR